MVDAMMMYRGMLLLNTFYPDSEFPWRVFLRPCSQVPRAAAGVPLQRGGAAEPDQERAAAARQPQLLRQLRQHHRQQDHGGLTGNGKNTFEIYLHEKIFIVTLKYFRSRCMRRRG